jgi:eukaryotic translation initiation factor 2C
MNADLPVVNIGNSDQPTYLPVEACKVLPGQCVATKLNSKQTREMILFACRKPADNANFIVEAGAKVLGLNPPTNPALGKKELTINPMLITVQARVLQAPQIQYFNKRSLHPSKGSWNMAAGIKFYQPASIGRWTSIEILAPTAPAPTEGAKEDLRRIVIAFADAMRKLGMIVPDPGPSRTLVVKPGGNDAMEACLRDLTSKAVQFVLIILPSTDATVYGRLKSMADRHAGFHTVCVLRGKFTNVRAQDQYFANVAMKFNLKAGGINQVLDPSKLGIIKDGSTMVVGIDVTHPSPQSQGNAPSVAGIVASIDSQLGQWPSTTRVQIGRTEIVADLEEMFKSRLILWHKHNKTYPRNILVYRDGVSEGQYQLVLDQETNLTFHLS